MGSPEVGIGDRIIAAVAQDPFVSGGNWFCTLIPICDLDGGVLSDEGFPNRGLIWWRVIEPVRDYAVPRNLVIVHLEAAPAYDVADRAKDYYQVGVVSPLKSVVNEIIPVTEHATSESLIRAGKAHLDRPVHGAVYFRTEEDVSGPWRATGLDEDSIRKATLVKPLQQERVWRWKWEEFEKSVNVIHRDVKIVTDWHWGEYDLQSYTLAFQDELKRAYERAERCDALSDRDIVSKIARATVTHAERRELERFFEAAIENADGVEDFRRLQPRMDTIVKRLKDFEAELRPLLVAMSRQDDFKPALEKRQEELAQEFVAERKTDLEAKAREELGELLTQQEQIRADIREEREAFEEERRRQDARLRKDREKRIRELDRQRDEFEKQKRQTMEALEAAANNYSEKRSEVIQDLLSMMPLLKEAGIVSQPLVGNGQVAVAHSERSRRAFELPSFVRAGVSEKAPNENDFLESWTQECREAGFAYTESDLLNFHIAMKSERFNVLAGPSGIGKSTLPRLYSRALHGFADEADSPDRYLSIPVRPGWMDTRDLLGYFNSLERAYEPSSTRLFEYLVYAREEEQLGHSGVYVINLDEINLSYVEHYFADFLSALQNPEGAQGIQCFYPDLCREDDTLREYGYLPISRGVRFVGTANVDETTKPFSPRMLDRVNVVELQAPTQLGVGGPEPESLGVSYVARKNAVPVSEAAYRNWTTFRPNDSVRASVYRAIEPIQKILHQYGYPISPRVIRAMVRYVANGAEIISEPEAIDRQLLQRVLPKLRGHTERFRQMLQELLSELPEERFPRANRRLTRMVESEYAMDFFHCIQEV